MYGNMQQPEQIKKGKTEESMSQSFAGESNQEQVKFLLSHKELLNEWDDYIRGKYFDPTAPAGQKWKNLQPMMNETGIGRVMKELKIKCSKIFSTTKFKEKEIEQMILPYSDELIIFLYANKERFDLSEEDIPLLVYAVVHPSYATLKQSGDATLLRFLKDNMKIVQTTNLGEKRGLFKEGGIFRR